MKANTRRTKKQEAAAPFLSLSHSHSLSLSLYTSPHNRKYISKLSQIFELLFGTSFNNSNNNNNRRSLKRDMQQKNEKLTFLFLFLIQLGGFFLLKLIF
jgi:hypothetical protein